MDTKFEQQIDNLRTLLESRKTEMYEEAGIKLPNLSELRKRKKIISKKGYNLGMNANGEEDLVVEEEKSEEEKKLNFQEAVELIKKCEQEPHKDYILWRKLSKEDKKGKIEVFLKKENIYTIDLFQQIVDEIDAGRLNTQKDVTWDKENERVIALGRIAHDEMKDIYYLKSNQPKKSDHSVIRRLKKNSYRK